MSNRPYYIVHNGVPRMIEASSPAQAVRHAVGAAITELRPARGGEVLAWQKSGKPFEDANAPKPPVEDEPAQTTGVPVVSTGLAVQTDGPLAFGKIEKAYTHADAIAFLQGKLGFEAGAVITDEQSTVMAIAHTAQVADQLTLEQFDEIRVAVPAFGEALSLYSFLGRASVDEIRRHLEAEPMKWDMVERSIAGYLEDDHHWSDRTHGADSAVDDEEQHEAINPAPTVTGDSAE